MDGGGAATEGGVGSKDGDPTPPPRGSEKGDEEEKRGNGCWVRWIEEGRAAVGRLGGGGSRICRDKP